MVSKKIKPNAQDTEQTNNTQPLESVIDSKVTVEKKIEVKKMDNVKKRVRKRVVKKKEAHRKQRKGKSLLTAFRINRMTRRPFFNVNRPCGNDLSRKYY